MADNAIVRECNDVTTQTTRFRCSIETCQSMHSRRVPLTTVNPQHQTVCGYFLYVSRLGCLLLADMYLFTATLRKSCARYLPVVINDQ